MRRRPYLFLGPAEKYFDSKSGSKVKKLVKALIDYEYLMNPKLGSTVSGAFLVRVKPNTGYATAVANAILEYREQNPNKPVAVELVSEYSTDFDELPEKTQLLFKKLVGEDKFYVMVQSVVKDGVKTGGKAAYSAILNGSIPVIWYEPGIRVDKAFEKEYQNISTHFENELINLFDNSTGETYSKDGVRKKAASLTYSYRINTTLPNGKKLTEEISNFVTVKHAKEARNTRLMAAMWQEVEQNSITLSELFNEYIETKGDTPALQTKYKQYHSSFMVSSRLGEQKIQDLVHGDGTSTLSLENRIGFFSLKYVTDGRYKNASYFDEDGNYQRRILTDEYKQGYYALLSNLFDYAYLKGYISYQPFLLVDISKL